MMRFPVIVLASVMFTTGGTPISSGWFDPPAGPLPWSTPSLPDAEWSEEPPTVTLDPVEHSTGYAAQLADTTTLIDDTTAPLTPLVDLSAEVTDPAGPLPVASEGDFELGFEPLGEPITATGFAADVGSRLGVLFQYARSIASFTTIGPVGLFFGFLLVVSIWFAVVNLVIFAIQIIDALWSFTTRLIDAIGEIVPL